MDPEVLEEFLVECEESREELDAALLALEEDASDKPAVDSAFRAVHSIKGAAGFMEARDLERVSHIAENLLQGIRDGRLDPRLEHFSALFEASDAIGQLIRELPDPDRKDQPEKWADLTGRLEDLASEADDGDEEVEQTGALTSWVAEHKPKVEAERAAEQAQVAAVAQPEPAPAPSTPPPAEKPAPKKAAPTSSTSDTSKKRSSEESVVRVDVGLLDDLMNLVGELVVCRNQILRVPIDPTQNELTSSIHQLDHLTSAIQEKVMKTRMRPVGGAWRRLPRMVRDLAASCAKDCQLVMIGEDVELDRSILAQIKDPLAHMIRNAVDHGLEDGDTRVANGKPRRGTVRLSASHVGGQVHIELADDGGGLNTERIRQRAIERGLVPEETAVDLSAHDVHQLIFEPGFSTAETVSRLSGRGVGMDVVRSNLQAIGGAVEVSSTVGVGTTVRLKIPLTLAILPALIVQSRGLAFAIPQAHLVELIDLECGVGHSIEELAGSPVLRRRGELLPLAYLDSELGLQQGEAHHEFVVVVRADDVTYGLCVDAVAETEEIVVKPLGPELDSVKAFSGATVRGDGSIALILDVVQLAKSSNAGRHQQVEAEDEEEVGERTMLLRFMVGGVGVGAVDVERVIRIEDVTVADLHRHGDSFYLDFNGRVTGVADLVGLPALAETQPVSLVVCRTPRGPLAVAVSEVLDVIDTAVDLTPGIGSGWSAGMALVEGRSTAILDLERLQVA